MRHIYHDLPPHRVLIRSRAPWLEGDRETVPVAPLFGRDGALKSGTRGVVNWPVSSLLPDGSTAGEIERQQVSSSMAGVATSDSAGIGFDTQPADDRRLNRLRRRQAHIQFGSMVEEVFIEEHARHPGNSTHGINSRTDAMGEVD